MPYYVSKTQKACGKNWAVVNGSGEVKGCHRTKTGAIAQMIAISIAEKVQPGGTWPGDKRAKESVAVTEADTYSPPQGVQNAAKRALKWISEGKAGSGFTSTGRARASQLASGKAVSRDTVARMKSYFARHEVDRKAKGFRSGEEGFPSPGRVAWDAWGGDAGRSWVNGINLEDK